MHKHHPCADQFLTQLRCFFSYPYSLRLGFYLPGFTVSCVPLPKATSQVDAEIAQ